MVTITNDHEFKLALDGLSAVQQRILGGKFVENVLGLCDDARIEHALKVASDTDASDAELGDAFRSAKAVTVKTYTDCGKETDWMAQANHFVAAAAASCLGSASQQTKENAAWKAAMQARMARNCELIERQDGGDHDESQTQYEITTKFLV